MKSKALKIWGIVIAALFVLTSLTSVISVNPTMLTVEKIEAEKESNTPTGLAICTALCVGFVAGLASKYAYDYLQGDQDFDDDGIDDGSDPDDDDDGVLDKDDKDTLDPDRDDDGIPDGEDQFPDCDIDEHMDRLKCIGHCG